MAAYFKVRLKELAGLIVLVLLSASSIFAQPQHLLPEKDFATGLPDNVVRVIRHDAQHRVWIGTDKGLLILNSNEAYLKELQELIGQSLVFSLLFYKEYILIGTWNNGLFVYNLDQKKIEVHFKQELINRCRKMRIFRDTVYIASKPTGFLATLQNNRWKLDSLKTPDHASTFIMDYFEWENTVYAAQHQAVTYLFPIKGDSLLTNQVPFLKGKIATRPILTGKKTDSMLYLGAGEMFYNIDRKFEFSDSASAVYADSSFTEAVWDMLFLKNRKFMATGNANNLRGMVAEPGITKLEESYPDYYVLSLGYDSLQKGLWYGVTEKGLFYWPLVEQSFHLPIGWQSKARMFVGSRGEVVMVKDKSYLKLKQSSNHYVPDGEPVQLPLRAEILFLEKSGDTLVVCTYEELYAKVGQKEYIVREPYKNYRGLYRIGSQIYTPFKYSDYLLNMNLKDGAVKTIPMTYTVLRGTSHNKGQMFFSSGVGFIYFDTVSKPVKGFFPVADDFKMLGDTLWVLLGRELKSFLYQKNDSSLRQLAGWEFKNTLADFIPQWVQVAGESLYLGSIHGFFKIDTKTAKPLWYQYTGKAKYTVKPSTFGPELYFHWENYLAKVAPEQPYSIDLINQVKPGFSDSLELMEKDPFSLVFNSTDYFIREHSLKKLELWKEEKLLEVHYILDSSFEFKQGLPSGNYQLKIWINGQSLQPLDFRVSIPLLKNPAFYISFTLFFLLMTGFIVYGWMNQKGLQKRLLESRLQLLKQNLNPHFIFNSLNLIYMLVLQKKNDEAVKTIANFSDLHRYYLENVSKNKVTLQEELSFIHSYLLLESERVHVDTPFDYHLPTNLQDKILGIYLPPMILQPLVENAVKYCFPLEKTHAQIWIDVSEIKGGLLIGIENTTHHNSRNIPKGTGSGIGLVKQRIMLSNESARNKIYLKENSPLKHCTEGYRIELVLQHL